MNIPKENNLFASAATLLFFVLIVYYPVVNAQLVNMDDVEMLMLHNNLEGDVSLKQLFFPDGLARYYRPFHFLSFYLDHLIWQQEASGYHLTNYLLHACNALLFLSILLALGRRFCINNYFIVPCVLLFALHPLTCESVAWVSGRTDIIASFFCFIALRVYLVRSIIRYFLVPVLLVLGLLAKESALVLVPLILMIDTALQAHEKQTIKKIGQSVCGWGLAMVPGLLFYLRMRMGGLDSLDQGARTALANNVAVESGLWFQNFAVCVFHFFASAGFYIKKLFFPFPLNFAIYQIASIPYFLFFFLLMVLAVLFSCKRKYLFPYWYILIIMSFFPALLVATSKIAWTSFAERYLYLSCAVWATFVFFGFSLLGRNFPRYRSMLIIFLWCIAVLWGVTTWQRTFVWKNDHSLWEATMLESPGYGKVMFKYGEILQSDGRKEEALKIFRKIVDTAKDNEWKSFALIKLGQEDSSQQKYNEALNKFQNALSLQGDRYSHEALAHFYSNLPSETVDEKRVNHNKAIFHYRKMYECTNDPFYLHLVAKMQLNQDPVDAKKIFSEIIQKYPGSRLADLSRRTLRSLQSSEASQAN